MWRRNFSNKFIKRYFEAIGKDTLVSVEASQREGRGIKLFDFRDRDFFSILGLSVVPLLAFLRKFFAEGTLM